MKKLLLACLFLLSGVAIMAQKEINDPNAQVRSVASFHGVKISTGIDAIITQGSSQAVAVSASEAQYRDDIVTEVKDGILHVYFKYSGNNIWKKARNRKLKAYIAVTDIDNIDANSGAEVKVDGAIKCANLSMHVTSGAEFKGELQATSIKIRQNSGATISVSGKTGELDLSCSSGGSFYGYNLNSDNCKADVSSGGEVQVTVNKELSAEASSGGSVYYKGEGLIRNIRTGSGGSVSRK